jgi:hypothetical protein
MDPVEDKYEEMRIEGHQHKISRQKKTKGSYYKEVSLKNTPRDNRRSVHRIRQWTQ